MYTELCMCASVHKFSINIDSQAFSMCFVYSPFLYSSGVIMNGDSSGGIVEVNTF